MSRGVLRHTFLLSCLLFITSIGSVFATWYYAEGDVGSVYDPLNVSLEEFVFSNITDEETEEVAKSLAQKFLEILNNSTDYTTLTKAMDDNYDGRRAWTATYIGNVAGSSREDTIILLD